MFMAVNLCRFVYGYYTFQLIVMLLINNNTSAVLLNIGKINIRHAREHY